MKTRKILSVVGVIATLTLSQAAQAKEAEKPALFEQLIGQASNDKETTRRALYQMALEAARAGNLESVRQHFNGACASFELDNQRSDFDWAMVFIAAANCNQDKIVKYLTSLPRFEGVQALIYCFVEKEKGASSKPEFAVRLL